MQEMKLLLILSLFSFALSQQCVVGSNCPYNQGMCVADTCECLDGYKTFFYPALPPERQIYCNYKQISHFYPLILEFFLPGIGHIYVGKYWFGIIKLCLAIIFASSCYYIYEEIKVPGYIEALKRAILNKLFDGDDDKPRRGKDGITLLDIAQFLFNITFHPFWILWAFDLYMYFTKSYNDGNGIALI